MEPSPSPSAAPARAARAPRVALPAGWRTAAWASALALWAGSGWAQPAPHPEGWTEQARQWAQESLQPPTGAGQGSPALRPEIEVGRLDNRLRLAHCARVEPYLPEGTRLWGRSRIGLRCAEGPVAWNVFLPVTVKVWGPAWVVRQPVAAGTALTPAHVEAAEIDWAESSTPVLARPQDWQGLETTRALMPGQALRQGMLRSPQAFAAGTQVRVSAQGKGFTLSVTGEALNHGHIGQSARVRLPNRKVLSGTVRSADTVEIGL